MSIARSANLSGPLLFEPIFQERIWGGRRLHSHYGKELPPRVKIGESWEIVDRPEAQSVVREGPQKGRSLHDLWIRNRAEIFGQIAESPRFPLLIKLLSADEKLSVQVHPPPEVAAELGGEPKTEFWYIADATPEAELYVGLREGCSRDAMEEALRRGTVAEQVHRLPVKTGDAMFLPSGRIHAIGAGLVIVEIQQNSDTTYRVFDWNRTDAEGVPRKLHIDQSLRSIDFSDCRPELMTREGESLLRHSLFDVDQWQLTGPRPAAPHGQFAIVVCLTGELRCADVPLRSGECFLVPASLKERELEPAAKETSLLRIRVRPEDSARP